jgi:hypothetical protein
MSATDERVALELEFDVFARRAQLVVPAERRAQLMDDFAELHRMVCIVRAPLSPDNPPDESFDLSTVVRML